MARGLTALRAALGAVGGVTDALQQRELLAEKRRRDEEAAAIQQAQLYASLGMRAQPYRPASEEQVGVPPASSMDRAAFTSALQRGMGVEPPTRDGATTSFQRSVQRGMGVEPTQAGATLSPLQSAFQKATSGDLSSSYTKRTAETPGMRQKLPGGMEVAWQGQETPEEKADRERTERNAKLQEALASLPESERARLEPVIRASIAGVPANVAQVMFAPKEEKTTRRVFDRRSGKIVDLDTGETFSAVGYQPPVEKTAGGKEEKAPDVAQLRVRAGMNEMLLADRSMRDFETRFNKGETKITVGQRVLQKLASDFSNEKEPLDKVFNSAAYKILADSNPELAEYMRNVDAYAEGETMVSSRPSNYRTKMAQFLSGIAAGSPAAVVTRVQQRRRGILAPLVKAYHNDDWTSAYNEAVGESGATAGDDTGTKSPTTWQEWGKQWMTTNPMKANESRDSYIARMTAAYRATGGK